MFAAACLGWLAMAPPEGAGGRHELPSALDVGAPTEAGAQRTNGTAGPPRAAPEPARTPPPGGVANLGDPTAGRYDVPPAAGDGLIGGGIGLLALGGFSITAGLLVLGEPRAGAPLSPALALSLGALTVAGGTASTVYGVRRHRRYRGWLARHHLPDQPSGLGLITSGGATLGIGALGVALTFAEVDTKDDEPLTAPLYVVFSSAMAAGVTMAAVGWVRHRRYQTWLADLPIEWTPYVGPTDTGANLGVIGRF